MAEIRNLTRNGETFYPLTCTDAVVDRDGNPLEIVNDIFDISEYNASGTPPTLAKYSTLALALAAVPQSKQKGGMTIRYVQTSDNKYIQARCMAQNFTTDVTQWQGVDAEVKEESHNLIESAAVYKNFYYIYEQHNGFINTSVSPKSWDDLNSDQRKYVIIPISVSGNEKMTIKASDEGNSIYAFLSEYNPVEDGDASVISSGHISTGTLKENIEVPAGSKFLYLLAKSSDTNRLPQIVKLSDIDILGLAKENIWNLKKYLDTNFPRNGIVIPKSDIIDNLVTDDVTKPLSAKQGKVLKDLYDSNKDELESLLGQTLDIIIDVPSGIEPAAQNVTVDVSSYGLGDGDTLYTYTDANNGVFLRNYIYINGVNKSIANAGVKRDFALTEDLESVRFRISTNDLVLDNGVTVGGKAVLHLIFKKGEVTKINEEIDSLDGRVAALEEGVAVSDVVSRNKDIEDAVHAAAFNLIPGKNSNYTKSFSMLVAGDIHSDDARMQSIVQYLNAMPSIDCGIMLGDIAGGTFADSIAFYTEALQSVQKPFLTVIGNHDAGSTNSPTTSYTTQASLIAKFITPNIEFADLANGEYTEGANCYYYKDFSTYKIRLIVLNQYDYPDADAVEKETLDYRRGFAFYSQAQISWLISTLASTPNDYHVIVCLHYAADNIRVESGLFTSEKYTGKLSIYNDTDGIFIEPNPITGGSIISDIINAWINKTSINYTYTYGITTTQANLVANADFTSRTESNFVCYFGGHWHNSIMSHVDVYNTQKQYNVDWAKIGSEYTNFSDTPRKIGTRSEDCFCIMTVDINRKRVNLLRIGAHWTEALIDRLAINFSY